jgi:hypothetical protein
MWRSAFNVNDISPFSFFPALPILTWVITFFSSRFIPVEYRPSISVSLLPTLESVLYGANISDILTRFTHPILDIPAWLSYGVVHFVGPFVVAAFLWLFAARNSLLFWCQAFGYFNLAGVIIQIIFPCAAPCKYPASSWLGVWPILLKFQGTSSGTG